MTVINNPTGAKLYDVTLGIDRAAKPTGQTMEVSVIAPDRLTAGTIAEGICDPLLPDPATMYTHAMSVTPVNRQLTAMAA